MGHNYDLEKIRRQQIITNRIYEEKFNRVYNKFGGHNYDPISILHHLRSLIAPSIATNVETGKMSAVAMSKPVLEAATIG